MGELENAVQELMTNGAWAAKMDNICHDEYGALTYSNGFAMTPFENMFNVLRGMRELALDVRKCPEILKECLDFLWENECLPMMKAGLKTDPSKCIGGINTGFLAHGILNYDQFGELYWPYFKQLVDMAAEADRVILIFLEATLERLADYFQEIPKGRIIIQIEQDDILSLRKAIPNVALMGGMSTDTLGYGTPEQCVEQAKRMINEMGDGFVLSQNKMMSYKNDAKRENLQAVCDFVREYEC